MIYFVTTAAVSLAKSSLAYGVYAVLMVDPHRLSDRPVVDSAHACMFAERQETPFDACGKRSYIRACRQMHVRPVKRVLVALGGSSVQIGRQGFKENQIIALTTALMVSWCWL